MISIEQDILNKFDTLESNRSLFIERAMNLRIKGIQKKDMPEEALTLKCSKCGKSVESGFYCELTRKFFCEKCNLETLRNPVSHEKIERFACGRKEEHEHLLVPGYNGFRIDLMKQLKQNEDSKLLHSAGNN
jgi:predicted amidophosphoribosyltransferase